MAAPDPIDYYDLLGIDTNADDDGIRGAILEQRRTWVRRQNAPSVERQRQAEDKIKAIAAAEDVLLDAARRAAYDRSRQTSLTVAPKVTLDKPAAPPAPPVETPPPPVHSPPPPPAPPQERIDWMARATEALRRGDLRSAKYAATEATERNPDNAQAWALRGSVSRADNRFDHAIYEFIEATRLAPSVETYSLLAGVHEAAGHPDEAAAAYHTAVTMSPGAVDPTIALANFWVRQSQPNTAVDLLSPLLQSHPTDGAVANALGFAMLYRVDSYLTMLNDGSYVFTSSQQVQRGRTDLHYALSLPLSDGDLIGRLNARVQQADRAEQRVWAFPAGVGCSGVGARIVGWIGLFLLALIVIPLALPNSPGLGFLALFAAFAAVIWSFFRAYRKPGWAKNSAMTRYHVVRPGI